MLKLKVEINISVITGRTPWVHMQVDPCVYTYGWHASADCLVIPTRA